MEDSIIMKLLKSLCALLTQVPQILGKFIKKNKTFFNTLKESKKTGNTDTRFDS